MKFLVWRFESSTDFSAGFLLPESASIFHAIHDIGAAISPQTMSVVKSVIASNYHLAFNNKQCIA